MQTDYGILDRPIAFHRCFVDLTGNVKAALMLSQAIYWQARVKQSGDGWWYKSAIEWEEETGLTRREQETARRDLTRYMATDLRGVPATLYYRVDIETLENDLMGKFQFRQKRQTSLPKSAEPVLLNTPNINKNTETTTEITNTECDDLLPPPKPQLHKPRTVEEYKASIKNILDNPHYSRFADFPEDVRPIIEQINTLWRLEPPADKKSRAFWITSSRLLITATAEFGLAILGYVYEDWLKSNPQYMVSSPKSLIGPVVAKAGKLRTGETGGGHPGQLVEDY